MEYYLYDHHNKCSLNILVDKLLGGRSMSQKAGFVRNDGMSVNEKGHYTTVDGVPVRKLYVGNLDGMVEDDLFHVFSRFGHIVDVTIVRPPSLRCFAFVTFGTPDEASSALRNKSKLFCASRKLYVSPADSWHQPLDLPNGQVQWNRRSKYPANEEDGRGAVENETGESGAGCWREVLEEEGRAEVEEEDVETAGEGEEEEARRSPIGILNDDCLLLIFGCLPLNHRIVLNNVCRRWRALNMSYMSGLRKLDFTDEPLVNKRLTNELLEGYLSLCPNITSINIGQDDHRLSSQAIVTIGKYCKSLEQITIREISFEKRSLAFLARSCPELKAFYMDACSYQHDGEMSDLVKKCSKLEKVSLKYCSSHYGVWLRHIRPPLKSLSLEMYDFKAEYLSQGLRNVKETMTELKLISCDSLGADDVEMIARCLPGLTSLTLAGGFTEFQSHTLAPIARLTNLVHLDLGNNSYVCDNFLNQLANNCLALECFSLSGIDDRYLSDTGLNVLPKFTGLTHLTLACLRKLNDSILKTISQKIKNLKHLDVMGCPAITDEGCQSIVNNCRELELLDVSGCMTVTNQTVLAAIECSFRPTNKKLRIIAGDSGIDLDVCWYSGNVIVDPSSSIMSRFPNEEVFILDSDLEMEDDDLLEDLYDDYEEDGLFGFNPFLNYLTGYDSDDTDYEVYD